ncbi:MAG: hypothetical protein JNN00_13025 [Chitinophagaceae bacterium]|nr:hypothetical protein [Chitinophagaceae bacterium]
MQQNFTRFAAVCCILSVITTLGIHVYFPDPPADFEKRVLLFRDSTYLLNRWWVIVHCLLVVVSMWGFALTEMKRSPGFAGIGFLFFCVFAFAEITRQMFVLFYINDLREQYVTTLDPAVKETLKQLLTYAGLLTAPLFGVFILSFGLGNLCYGIALTNEKGFGKVLSVLLLMWGAGALIAFGNSFWKQSAIDSFVEKYNFTYQPLMRILIAWWLWKRAGEIQPSPARP